jgi:hypothetical protein
LLVTISTARSTRMTALGPMVSLETGAQLGWVFREFIACF